MADPHEVVGQRTVAFTQRSLLRPWRVERIVQQWQGRKWVVLSRTKVRRG